MVRNLRTVPVAVDLIKAMEETAGGIASAMEQQSAATREIARSVDQASRGAAGVADNMGGVQTASEETERSAARVAESSAKLETQTAQLSASVSEFLAELKKVV